MQLLKLPLILGLWLLLWSTWGALAIYAMVKLAAREIKFLINSEGE